MGIEILYCFLLLFFLKKNNNIRFFLRPMTDLTYLFRFLAMLVVSSKYGFHLMEWSSRFL